MADECEDARSCPVDPEENQLEVDDPSILPETGTGPVEVGPPVVTGPLTPCDISYLQSNFKQLINFSNQADAIAVATIYDKDPIRLETEQRDHYGFIESDEVSSDRTEDITIDLNPLSVSFKIMGYIESQIKTQLLGPFDGVFGSLYDGLSHVVPNLHDPNATKGFIGINRCGFLSKYTTVIYYAGKIPYSHKDEIVRIIEACNAHINPIIERWSTDEVKYKCKVEKSPVQYDTQKIILCITLATGNVIQIPILNVVGFPVFQDVTPLLQLLGCVSPQSLHCFVDDPTSASPQFLSLLDIIVRVRICANQGAITALSEPSKEEVTLILRCFQHLIPQGVLPPSDVTAIVGHIHMITQAIGTTLYSQDNIKAFSLFCNIFYNFINVSLGFRSLAKIIYSDFFGTSDNYGKVIRICKVVNSLPIMNDHVKFFLTGSNAARVYLALNEIIKLGGTINPGNVAFILSKTFGNLSDNDFMIYLKNDDSEPYRVFIRMILGGSFYFFKNLFDDTTTRQFTLEMIQSVGIVGFMDHLFAQRFDASAVFLQQCYRKDPTSFLAHILPSMEAYFGNLDKQINVAQFDEVFKYYTLKKFYQEVFRIFGLIDTLGTQAGSVYTFLIDHATSIDCIATVWTLVLNVLYTLFVPENCLARIVVGKFDNDPKNLKLYMEILNDHLYEVGRNSTENEESDFIKDIKELLGYQKSIIDSCNGGINRGLDEERLNLFKQTCGQWVLKMVSMVVRVPGTGESKYKGLFMLSEADAGSVGNRSPTTLERALCLAYLPTLQGNICSAASSPSGQVIFRNEILKIMTTRYSLDKTLKFIDPNEIALNARLNAMGSLMFNYFTSSNNSRIVPTPPIPGQQIGAQLPLSTYLNFMWNHLTKTAIKLKILFKENLQDTKRVTGIKYIALVLGGYFQIRLLVNDTGTVDYISENLLLEIKYCKRGLLPLLLPNPLLPQNPFIDLISNIIEIDIGNELSHAAAAAITIAYLAPGIPHENYNAAAVGMTPEQFAANRIGITPGQYAAAADVGITPAQYAAAYAAIATFSITPEKYVAAVTLGITPAQYAAAYAAAAAAIATFGITPEKYVAAVTLGITPEKYAAAYAAPAAPAADIATFGITPDQYTAAYALSINPDVYAAAYAAAIATFGITPDQYNAIYTLGINPDVYAAAYAAAIATFGITPLQYNAVYTLGITPQQYADAAIYANAYNIANTTYHSRIDVIKMNRGSAVDICFHAAATTVGGLGEQAANSAYVAMYAAAYNAATADPMPRILKILGFLFSIKVKSSSPHSPYQLLRLEDSMLSYQKTKELAVDPDPKGRKILKPTDGIFIEFITNLLRSLGISDKTHLFDQIMKCICREGGKTAVEQINSAMLAELTASTSKGLYDAVGGSNDSESNSGRNSVSSLNKHKHKYKHNKLSRTNHTRKNKYKRNNKNKKHKSSPKYRKVVPSSRSGSQSNRKKSKSKLPHKNVTFKRRRARK